MLELTKVINELRDVLIQQVESAPARPLNPSFLGPLASARANLFVFDPSAGQRDLLPQEHHLRVSGLR